MPILQAFGPLESAGAAPPPPRCGRFRAPLWRAADAVP